jgi:ATP/maltotriose-dependent transcriptional regulator MalT
MLLSTACTLHGQVDQLQGRSAAARTWLERGLAVAEHLDVGPGEFLVDPLVGLLGMLAVPLLHLGFVEEARAAVERASMRARARRWPMATLTAIWYGALVEVRLGNAGRVGALADEIQALVDEFALAHGRTACRWFRGWADAQTGRPRDGYCLIREAYDENARLGMLAGASEILGYATEALLLDGDLDGGEKQLKEALRMADRLGERVYLPQLLLMEAAIGRARGDVVTADAAIARAVAEARAQDSPWLELTTLTELCEHGIATAEDRRALATVVDRLPQAHDTTAVAKARRVLDKPGP